MSARIRGQEATLRINVDGEIQTGTFFKVPDFTVTPRQDLPEQGFLGETEDDIDFQHHGYDFAFTVQEQDEKALNFLSEIVDREANHEQHPKITILVLYAYRANLGNNKAEVYRDVFLKIGEKGFSGRKEYVTTSFEGKCKKRSLLAA